MKATGAKKLQRDTITENLKPESQRPSKPVNTHEKQKLNENSSEGQGTDMEQHSNKHHSTKAKQLNFYDQPSTSQQEGPDNGSLEAENVDNSEVIFQGSTRGESQRKGRAGSHRERDGSKKSSGRGNQPEEQPQKVVTNIITNNNYNNFIINNPKIEVTTAVPIVGLNSAPAASSSH